MDPFFAVCASVRFGFTFLSVCCCLVLTTNRSLADEEWVSETSNLEGAWVGWLETPAQHLRLLIQIQKVAKSSADSSKAEIEGTITSLDQVPNAVPFSECSIADDGSFQFKVTPQENSKLSYSFAGKRNGEQIDGMFENANAKLPLSLRKVDSLPEEGVQRLGANSAWTGELNLAVQKISVRFRIYDQPPYATSDSPRILFDSLSEKANGFPVKWGTREANQSTMTIPSLPGNAKFIIRVEQPIETIRGRFVQSLLPLPLELTRVEELRDCPIATDAMILALQRQIVSDHGGKSPQPPSPPRPDPSLQPSLAANTREDSFVIERVDYRKPRIKQDGRWLQPKFRISGTITRPSNVPVDSKLPAVVMVSGSGPQDRDETIGSHKPFRVMAHWLAENGVASLRYDDRGVGESTGDFLNSTTSDFADDASAVWEYARGLEGIDRLRVGILGHSEGAMIGPQVAANQSEVAFLILLAPPGLAGTEILASQIDRMAELQGVDPKARQATGELQRRLQRLALERELNDERTTGEIRHAVLEQWEALRTLSSDGSDETEQLRRQRVIDQIATQFQGLQTPWMRNFLATDPAAAWLVMRSPTLALWGDKDVQVLAEPNRQRLADVAARNLRLQCDLVVLPEINHLMQRAKTGLPDEYDQIKETIDPSVLEVIKDWMRKQNLIP